MRLIRESCLGGNIGRRGSFGKKLASAFDAKGHEVLQRGDGEPFSVGANECVFGYALYDGQLGDSVRLGQMSAQMREHAQRRFFMGGWTSSISLTGIEATRKKERAF